MQELEEFLEKQRDINLKMLQDLLQQQSLLQHNLIMGLQSLKKCIETLPLRISTNQVIQSRVTITRKMQHDCILQQLGKRNYLAFLNMEGEIKEIYRERMFSLPVSLRDLSGNIIMNEDCRVYVKIYTAEKFPKEVQTNIKGKPIFKGSTQITIKGKGEFTRMSITEVSSHFPSGKFIMAIHSEQSHIKPVILDNVIVKAKKLLK